MAYRPWFGVSTAAFFPWDLRTISDILHAQPLPHVELMPQAPQECNPAFAGTLRRLLGDSLRVSSIHFPLILHHFLADPYPAARSYARQLCRSLADLAGALDSHTIIVHGSPKDMTRADFVAVSRENIGYLADRCHGHGVAVALENTPEGATSTVEQLRTWLSTINRPSLATCLDVGHAHRAGLDPVLMAHELPHLDHVHVHGFHPQHGDHRLLQEGIVNWQAVAEALARRGFVGGIVIELKPETLGADPKETLRQNAAFLVQTFGGGR